MKYTLTVDPSLLIKGKDFHETPVSHPSPRVVLLQRTKELGPKFQFPAQHSINCKYKEEQTETSTPPSRSISKLEL